MPQQATVTHILTQMILNARLITNRAELQQLLEQMEPEVIQAVIDHNLVLDEHQVMLRYPFLNRTSLRNMRFRETGPAYHKLGSHRNSRVSYRIRDIESWLAENHRPFNT